MTDVSALTFVSLEGETSYEDIRKKQLELVEDRIADRIPDTVLFLEHRPVITRGRGLQQNGSDRSRHMPIAAIPEGVEFHDSERGGDLTYHGPGQLVIYPICKLDGSGFGPNRDVTEFIRKLERLLIAELSSWGIQGESRHGATGVWAGGKKVASIGVAVRKWVTYHGMAINCVNDLSTFRAFSPCGFAPEVMGRLKDLLEVSSSNAGVEARSALNGASWRPWFENRLAARFHAR
ncbi:MAG: lipoyl(octanoyl) transferase [Bdellovibrionales bacterium GWB1_55_8]|nr:MAG: lipoyl(octanoyl) transferase [Bdellovibrionales bacterium GWB1_55_8]